MRVIYTIPEVEELSYVLATIVNKFTADKHLIVLQALLDTAWFTINDTLGQTDIATAVRGLIHEPWFLAIDVNLLHNLSPLLTNVMLWLTEVIIKHGLVASNMIVKYTPGFITLQ